MKCQSPVRWNTAGDVELRCEAATPCPYHDRDGLTVAQRSQWRRTWAFRTPPTPAAGTDNQEDA